MNENIKLSNAKILIIDDDVNIMDILTVILKKYGHSVSIFTEPVSAIEELKSNSYDILIVNYLMTPVNGDRIIELVREFNKEIYIILMSMHRDLLPSIETMRNLEIQAYFEKGSKIDQLIILIQSGIKYIEQLRNIQSMGLKLDQYLVDFAKILLNTVSAKDHYTEEHSIRVSNICVAFARYLHLTPSDIEVLRIAGLFHDIGKIGIPDNVLLKEGKLTDLEFETIKSHPVIGANIFSVSDIFKSSSPIIYSHHERYDGRGYPEGIKGEDIPYLARLLTIADSFDAIMSKRPYKEKISLPDTIIEIEKSTGTQFDPDLSEKFLHFVELNVDIIQELYTN